VSFPFYVPTRVRVAGIALLALITVLAGCISVNLTKEIPKSKGLRVSPPSSPFREAALAAADQAWKSDATGSTISYFSECAAAPTTPERLRDDALASLPAAKILESQTLEFDGREALRSQAEGKVEGIALRVSLLTYQKNSCRYTISYAARSSVFSQELGRFDDFLKGFSAP